MFPIACNSQFTFTLNGFWLWIDCLYQIMELITADRKGLAQINRFLKNRFALIHRWKWKIKWAKSCFSSSHQQNRKRTVEQNQSLKIKEEEETKQKLAAIEWFCKMMNVCARHLFNKRQFIFKFENWIGGWSKEIAIK